MLAASAVPLRVVEVDAIDQLDSWRLMWDALLGQTREATFFQSCQWLQACWPRLAAGCRLRVLVVSRGGQPVGILPLVQLRRPALRGSLRLLGYPPLPAAAGYGPLGPHPTATLLAALRYLADTPRDWDVLELRGIARDEVDRGRTRTALDWIGLTAVETAGPTRGVIDLAGGWQRYWASRPQPLRAQLARPDDAASTWLRIERYRPRGVMYGDADPRWDLVDDCRRVLGRDEAAAGADMFPTLVDAHAAAVRAGAVDLTVLRRGQRPLAFVYNYVNDGVLTAVCRGADRRHAGAGRRLMREMIRDSFARGDRRLDLGPAAPAAWLTGRRTSYRCVHYRRTSMRATLLRMRRALSF